MTNQHDMHGTLNIRWPLVFLLLILAGLIVRTLRHADGPEDDPVHGMFVPNPITLLVHENQERWLAELDAEDKNPPAYDETQIWHRTNELVDSGWKPSDETKAWFRVYNEREQKRILATSRKYQ